MVDPMFHLQDHALLIKNATSVDARKVVGAKPFLDQFWPEIRSDQSQRFGPVA